MLKVFKFSWKHRIVIGTATAVYVLGMSMMGLTLTGQSQAEADREWDARNAEYNACLFMNIDYNDQFCKR